jgi:hypothetical protein
MNAFKLLAALLICAGMSACSTYQVDTYNSSPANVVALRALPEPINLVSANAGGRDSITCRAVGPVRTPNGETFEAYVANGVRDELRLADRYAAASPTTVRAQVSQLDFSSSASNWTIAATLTWPGGASLTKQVAYPYAWNFVGEIACQQTARAFARAVQALVGELVTDPAFAANSRRAYQEIAAPIS